MLLVDCQDVMMMNLRSKLFALSSPFPNQDFGL